MADQSSDDVEIVGDPSPPRIPAGKDIIVFEADISTWHPRIFHIRFTVGEPKTGVKATLDGPEVKLGPYCMLKTTIFLQKYYYSFQIEQTVEQVCRLRVWALVRNHVYVCA